MGRGGMEEQKIDQKRIVREEEEDWDEGRGIEEKNRRV